MKVWVMTEWGPGEVIGVVSSAEEAIRRGFVPEEKADRGEVPDNCHGTFSGPFEVDDAPPVEDVA